MTTALIVLASIAAAPDTAGILRAADAALADLQSMAYTARYERVDLEPGQPAPEPDFVEGHVWIERHGLDDRLGWKIASVTRMSHPAVKQEGVYAHWAYDGEFVTLIHPDKQRATFRSGDGVQSIVADFFRGNLLPGPFRATADWRTPQVDPFQSLAANGSKVTRLDDAGVGGVRCHVIDVEHALPEGATVSDSTSRWWFATTDRLPRRIVQRWTFDGTTGIETLEITDVRIDGWIDPGTFRPSIPDGYSGSDRKDPPAAEADPPAAPAPSQVGDPAPDFTLRDGAGHEHALSGFRDRTVVLDFWGTWCAPCRLAMPGLQRLHETYGDQGLVVLGISCRERAGSDPAAFLEARGYTYLNLADGDDVARLYSVRAYPTVVVVGPDGRIVHRHEGHSEENETRLEAVVQRPLADLSLDEIIRRLPPAGCEGRLDHAADAWLEHPASAELAHRLNSDGVVLDDTQWQDALRRSRALTVRAAWPRDVPFAVSMAVPRWLAPAHVRAVPDVDGLRPAEVGERSWSFSDTIPAIRRREAKYQQLGRLPEGVDTIAFHIVVERAGSSPLDLHPVPAGELWQGKLEFPVQLVDGIGAAVPPVHGDELDAAVRASIGAGFREWYIDGDDVMTAFVVVDPDTSAHPVLARTGLSLELEVLRDGEVVERGAIVPSRNDELSTMSCVTPSFVQFYASRNLHAVPTALAGGGGDLDRWALRVRGVSDHVLVLWDAETRWGGELVVPLREAIAREAVRTRLGGRGPEMSTPYHR